MAKVNVSLAISGVLGDLVIVWYKASAELAEVGRSAALPFPVQQEYTVENLQSVVYLFKFYQATGSTLNQLISTLRIDAAQYNAATVETFYYVVNRGESGTNPTWADPASSQSALRDERLNGQSYTVDETGRGPLTPGIDFVDRSDAGGGFDLLEDNQFSHGTQYRVTVTYKQTLREETNSGTGNGGDGDYTGKVTIDANGVFDPALHLGRIVQANFATAETGVLTFPEFSTIRTGKTLFTTRYKSSGGGNQQYFKLQFPPGAGVWLAGRFRNWLLIGKSEAVEITWIDGDAIVTRDETGYNRVGLPVMAYIMGPNTVLRFGAEYTYAQAGRLIDHLLDEGVPAQIVAYATWSTEIFAPGSTTEKIKPYNKFFAVQYAPERMAIKIRVPDSRGVSQKAIDGSLLQTQGSYEHDQVGSHTHPINKRDGRSDESESGTTGGFMKDKNASGTLVPTATEVNGEGENRVKSELLLPLLYI